MIYKNKRDREAWIREKSINSMKENIYIDENDIIEVSSGNFYKAVKTTTDIPLKNNLFAQLVPSEVVGNITTATKLKTARNIALSGDVTGNANFDGSANISITTTVGNDSHTHSDSTITSLDGSKINTGTISADRLPVLPTNKIPNIDASKITSGTIDISRLPAAALERCVVVQNDAERFALTKAQVQVGDSVKVITPDDLMYVVVDDNKLNQEAGYVKYGAAVKWETIKDKPSTFPPSTHTHTKNQITDFPVALKNPTALTIQLNGGTANVYDGSAAKSINITPASIGAQVAGSYAPNGHTHDERYYTETEVNNLLNGKANTSHGNHVPATQTASNKVFLRNDNTWATITPANIGAQPAGSYAAASHTHPATQVTQDANNRFVTDTEKNTWNNKMSLSGGTFSEGAIVKGICGGGTDYWFIKGAGTDDNGYLEIGTQDNGDEPIYVRQYNTSNNITHSITLMDANGNQTFNTTKVNGSFTSTGTVTCSDCVTTSDERLKKDIIKIDNALEKVNQLNGYTFLKEGDEKRTTGVLAQELLNVLPEAVFEREDGYYSVSYGNIVGLLIEAIKELQGEVKRLKGDC